MLLLQLFGTSAGTGFGLYKTIHEFNVPKIAKIVDVGGGDNKLVDFLPNAGFENITVLDISPEALEKSKQRLGKKAKKVNWL